MDERIYCPGCGRRMVYVFMVVRGFIFHTWQCDCHYRAEPAFMPPEIVAEICRAREWDDGSVVLDINFFYQEEEHE